jgi:dTMP kinase
MKKSKFITFEGADGTGKSTQIKLLTDYLNTKDINFIVTREPGGTEISEIIREWVLHGEHDKLQPQTETLMMVAARSYHTESLVRPSLEEGIWVISDRYADATIVYQGCGGGMPTDVIMQLNNIATGGLTPDITFLLDADSRLGQGRIANRQLDYFEKESKLFFKEIRNGYLKLAKEKKDRIKIIKADRTEDEVFNEIKQYIADFL